MTKSTASVKALRKRLKDLYQRILYHNDLYYNKNAPELTDEQYDQLREDFLHLSNEHPDDVQALNLILPVGAPVPTSMEKIKHSEKLLSLDNAYDEEMRSDFLQSALVKHGWVGEVKIDGLAVRILYENGILTQAVTRGDGYEGEDVTNQVKDIPCLPKSLPVGSPDLVEVGAEVYLSFPEFTEINKRLQEEGADLLSSPRNAAAGILRRKADPAWDRNRLGVFCYTLARSSDPLPDTQMESLDLMRNLGLPINDNVRLLMTADAVEKYFTDITFRRNKLTYPIDGVVVKVNDRTEQQSLGVTGRFPKWAMAFKFPAPIYQTTLKDIITQVGRTGVVTPVAILEPVVIDGVTVTRATLHNEDYITKNDIRIGDVVGVQRAGDVIPRITGPLLDKMDGVVRANPYTFDTECPSCHSNLVRLDDEAAWKCLNVAVCPAQRLERLVTFVSRDAMDIVGLSRQTLAQFLKSQVITTARTIYDLGRDTTPAAIALLDGWTTKSVGKLLEAIEKSRTVPLNRFIYALQIDHVGRTVSRQLAEEFVTLRQFLRAMVNISDTKSVDYQTVRQLPGVGDVIIKSMQDHFHQSENALEMHELADCLTVTDMPVAIPKEGPLSGSRICFTGTFTKHPRKYWEDAARAVGAKVVSKVTETTLLLVVGDGGKAGSKLKDAKTHKVMDIPESYFQFFLDMPDFFSDEALGALYSRIADLKKRDEELMLFNLKVKSGHTA